jgi:intein/homing endonuclease
MGIEIEPPKKLRSGKAEEWYPGKFLKEWKPLIPRKKLLGELMTSPPILVGGEWVNSEIDKMIEAKKTEWRCLGKDALILCNPGVLPIYEVKNQKVFSVGKEGLEIFEALGSRFSGVRELYRVSTGSRELTCTDDHLFLTVADAGEYRIGRNGLMRFKKTLVWKPLKELRIGDPIVVVTNIPEKFTRSYPIPQITTRGVKPDFPAETTDDFMWLMGVYLADGNSRLREVKGRKWSGEVRFSIPESDDSREPLLKLLESFSLKPHTDKKYVIVYSVYFAKLIQAMGFGGDTHSKHLPTWVYTCPLSQRLSLLAGFIEGDGHIDKKGRLEITTVNKELARELLLLANMSYLSCSKIFARKISKHVINGHKVANSEYFRFVIASTDIIPIRGEKKRRRLKSRQHRKFKYCRDRFGRNITSVKLPDGLGFDVIKSIEKVNEGETYDVPVLGSDNFIANSIVVHNSKGYSENLIRMAEDLAKSWVAKLSETFAPPDVREAVVRHMMPKGLEVADRWLATIGAAVMASKSSLV